MRSLLLQPNNFNMILQTLLNTYFSIILILIPLSFFCRILLWIAQIKVNEKAKQPGWAAFIPYYSIYILSCIGNCTGAFWTLLGATGVSIVCSPFMLLESQTVNVIFLIIRILSALVVLICKIRVTHGVSTAFGHGFGFTIGMYCLPFVFYPILAWGPSRYKPADNDATSPYNGREHGYAEMIKNTQNEYDSYKGL